MSKLHPLTEEIKKEVWFINQAHIPMIDAVIWKVTQRQAELLISKHGSSKNDRQFMEDVKEAFGLNTNLYTILREKINTERTEEIIKLAKEYYREHPEELNH